MDNSLTHEHHTSWGEAIGKLLLFILLLKWTYTLLLGSDYPWILLDSANLLVHEAGHLLFAVFGEFLGILGGSLTQILIPLAFGIYFMQRMNWFSFFFCLFWLGESITNVARYIMDANVQQLSLLGGEGAIHDWNWLLNRLNLLQYDVAIGMVVFYFGAFCIGISLCMMFSDLYYSFRRVGSLHKAVEV